MYSQVVTRISGLRDAEITSGRLALQVVFLVGPVFHPRVGAIGDVLKRIFLVGDIGNSPLDTKL